VSRGTRGFRIPLIRRFGQAMKGEGRLGILSRYPAMAWRLGLVTYRLIDDKTELGGGDVSGTLPAPTVKPRGGFRIALSTAGNTPYVGAGTGTGSYVTVGFCVWPGSGNVTSPTAIKALVYNSAAGNIDCRIQDVTNAATIAGATGITSTTTTNIADLGAVSNLTATAAVWAIQIRKNSGAGEGRLSGVSGY